MRKHHNLIRKKKGRGRDKRPKFKCKVKIDSNTFVWYGNLFPVRSLKSFVRFLDRKYGSNWRFFNVYDYNTNIQIDYFTKYKRP